MKRSVVYMLFVICFSVCLAIFSNDVYAAESFPFNGMITADALGVHNEKNYKVDSEVTQLSYGSKVVVTAQATSSMYEIKYEDGKIGYVSDNYIINIDSNTKTTDVSGIETYKDYCSSLINKGFSESYCPYLYYLHSKYPKWEFVAENAGRNFNTVVSSEQYKLVLQTSNKNYWLSTTPLESDYYYINSIVISSFMDPRNSLFEEQIFQFLDFESSKDIINTEALADMATGNLNNYLSEFKTAASNNGVNALHLLSRSKQEGASNSNYAPVKGTYTTDNNITFQGKTLNGFYNFYNIGAYAGDGLTPIGRGIAYAAGYVGIESGLTYQRAWNTPAKAISGGAEFIVGSYVKKGQNTAYYEKFNVGPLAHESGETSKGGYEVYSHQYMTNIYASVAESSSIYSAYEAGNILNSNFKFIIPVYSNMPEVSTEPVNKSSNNNLSSITINGQVINGFDKDIIEYNQSITTNDASLLIGATVEDSTATVAGVGTINFVNDVINASIVVTAEDGSTKTYVVNIKRVPLTEIEIKPQDIVNKMDVRVTDNVMYGMSPNTLVSTLLNTVSKNGGTASIKTANGEVKNSGVVATGYTIVISGSSESLTYKIGVRGDINGDASVTIIDLLTIQKHILNKSVLTGEKYRAADVNYDGSVTIIDLLMVQKHILGKTVL